MRTGSLLLCLFAIACGTGTSKSDETLHPSIQTTFGGSRPVTLRVPKSYDKARPAPLIVLLHGYGVDAAAQVIYFGFDSLVDEAGVLIAAPNGTKNAEGSQFWNATDYCCDFEKKGIGDVAYITGLIDEISAEYNVDAKRIYLVGHSNGGFMSYRIACDQAGKIAAVVSLAGGTWLDSSRCTPSGNVNILQIHGTNDKTILYDGQPAAANEPGYPGALADVEQWKSINHCSGSLGAKGDTFDVGTQFSPSMVAPQSMSGCSPGGAVDLWTIEGGAHIPPLGESFRARVWEWLEAHPKF